VCCRPGRSLMNLTPPESGVLPGAGGLRLRSRRGDDEALYTEIGVIPEGDRLGFLQGQSVFGGWDNVIGQAMGVAGNRFRSDLARVIFSEVRL
jgi:hypothetical protein